VIIGLIVFGGVVLLVVAILCWRLFRGDVEVEPGGSLGTQLFGRKQSEDPDDY